MELEAKVVLLDGLRISIERYSTGFEYKIDYTAVRGVRILSGIAELAKISVESPPSEAAVHGRFKIVYVSAGRSRLAAM